MRDLDRLRPCALRLTVACPDAVFDRIVPRPGPAWCTAVRRHLAEWLEHDLADAFVDLPVGVCVRVADAGPDSVRVIFDDPDDVDGGPADEPDAEEPDAEEDRAGADALSAVAIRVVRHRYPFALRRAKRQADSERRGACPDCLVGKPVAAADLCPGDRYRPAIGPSLPWRTVDHADPRAGIVLADDGDGGHVLYAVAATEMVQIRDPWCGC